MAITGPSGSGKTTLLHALAGISVPDSGQVRFHAADGSVAVQELSAEERARLRREHFGFVFQQGLLLDERRDPVPLRLCRAPAGRAPVGATTTPSPGCGCCTGPSAL
ncbi:ATP-binding cassette domain-containing protein [Kocuria sp. SL71]|uniref:ATP-binding cassette domain-containing protein n=1 Tax=Kocuria sp. SL71 TaxID=2995151 RepID=UPI002DD436B3|nr:ATP-binding cassette domain-containing protein [Kocuria sp. SL71]